MEGCAVARGGCQADLRWRSFRREAPKDQNSPTLRHRQRALVYRPDQQDPNVQQSQAGFQVDWPPRRGLCHPNDQELGPDGPERAQLSKKWLCQVESEELPWRRLAHETEVGVGLFQAWSETIEVKAYRYPEPSPAFTAEAEALGELH